jgi:threonine synthase
MDPHSAIAYLGLTRYLKGRERREGQERQGGREGQDGRIGIFLATAHPAKFSEIVEPILGHSIETPAPLAEALAQPRHVLKINASFDAVRRTLDS